MPPGVITLANDVELDLLLAQVVEEPARPGPVPATINMNDDLRLDGASGVLDSARGSFNQSGELGPLGRSIVRAADAAIWPQEAADDFVADLDIFGHRSRRLEGRNSVAVVHIHLPFKSSESGE